MLKLLECTPFLTYVFPIKDLRKIAILLASNSKCNRSNDATEDKMSMRFSKRFRHNTTHWFNSHIGMTYYFNISQRTIKANNIRRMKLLYTNMNNIVRDKYICTSTVIPAHNDLIP